MEYDSPDSQLTATDMDYRQLVFAFLLLALVSLRAEGQAIDGPALEDRDLVLYAGGAIEIRPPIGWHVAERPVGREVRLVLSPQPLEDAENESSESLWLSLHIRSDSERLDETQLRNVLAARIQRLAMDKSQELGTARSDRYQSRLEVRQPYSIKLGDSVNPQTWNGVHALILLPMGILEIRGTWPARDTDGGWQRFESAYQTLRFHDVSPENGVSAVNGEVGEKQRDAAPILGSWKAYRSRLRLEQNGRIQIRPDRIQRASFEEENARKRDADLLIGAFHCQGDLLFVTWKDGSKLNFRWRLEGDDLLLTDHEGQISQLRRILE